MEDKLIELIQKITAKQISYQVSTGTAININPQDRTCDILLSDDVTLFNCRLNSIISSYDNHILIIPKENSIVGFIQIEGNSTDIQIISYSDIEQVDIIIGSSTINIKDSSIILNNGQLGGLINIEQLTNKLNTLISTFNSHTHSVTTTGSASAQSGLAAAPSSPMSSLNKADYEDTTIKH